MGVLKMMLHVMLFQGFEIAAFDVGMVDGIVGHIVKEVTDQIADEIGSDPKGAKNQIKEVVETKSQGNADGRNHDQAEMIVGIVVMDSMGDKVDALANFSRGFPVKNKTMQNVFREGPDENTQSYEACNLIPGEVKNENGSIQKVQGYGDKDDERHCEMHPRKLIQQIIAEYSNAFIFCRYKGLFHSSGSDQNRINNPLQI